MLQEDGELHHHEFQAPDYRRVITRYAWGRASALELAGSLKARGYFSHGTAAALHGLTERDAKTIHLNVEQSPKPSLTSSLTQGGPDLAFSRHQRQSNLRYIYLEHDVSVVIIAGKNTDRLGVIASAFWC